MQRPLILSNIKASPYMLASCQVRAGESPCQQQAGQYNVLHSIKRLGERLDRPSTTFRQGRAVFCV
jgi:hypothetical protein